MQRPKVRDVARGKWPGILAGYGLTESQLSGRHVPCPMCGGNDRFRFDDKDGGGTFFCSHCGAGDGVRLVTLLKDWDFKTAAREIEQAAGVVKVGEIQKQQGGAEKLEKLRSVWSESKPLQSGDEAARYLAGRGLTLSTAPDCLRLHPGLPYYDGDKLLGKFPALIARVVDVSGHGLTLHRTYLSGGKKAPVPSPKKMMPGKSISGGSIRLGPVSEWIGIAEGIETALAASQLFNVPVWSCVSTAGIESFIPPEGVRSLTIFADNDVNHAGLAAAYSGAHRLAMRGMTVEVCAPPTVGDWLDYLNEKKEAA
jgi:putative DNA primase/helicase